MSLVRFDDLSFDSEFLYVRGADGSEVRFTRQERALLIALVLNPGKLLTRERLLDALGTDDGEMSERNVDLLVNRLRAKLRDKARAPHFIATQYGEGYVWIARPLQEPPVDAFLLIGPAYGMPDAPGWTQDVLAGLTATLRKNLAQRVVSAPQWRPSQYASGDVNYTLDISFHDDGTVLHAALVLRDGPAHLILRTIRASFHRGKTNTEISRIASSVKDSIWSHLAKSPSRERLEATELPMELRLHEAALMLSRTPESWRENEAQLIRARAERPDDPEMAVMWGLQLFTQLLHPAPDETHSPQKWAATEDAIETLALDHLAAVQDNPLLVLAVAKLLIFVDRGHMELAEALAQDAFAKSTAFAAAFAILAQIRMFGGHLTEALTLFDRGIELSERGSEFHIYLLILKCSALLASNDRAAVNALSRELYALKPITRIKVGLFFADPDAKQLPADIEMLLTSIDESRARDFLNYMFNFSTRYFQTRQHRRNVMAGLNTHMIRRFGQAIMPDHIIRALDNPAFKPAQVGFARGAAATGNNAAVGMIASSDRPAASVNSEP